MFTAMGMEGFAERTRRELLATGAAVRQRTADAVEQLTEQEALIARLARDGLSNPEIGASFSSAPVRSNGTCARCSPSWASAPGGSCGWPWPITVGR
jgi:hypothetical protein